MLRMPPQAVEVEKVILGALFLDPEGDAAPALSLSADDFFLDKHRELFEAMKALEDRRQPITEVTVAEALRASGRLEAAGGEGYLVELARGEVSAANTEAHAEIVREKARRRRLILKAVRLVDDAYAGDKSMLDLLAQGEEMLTDPVGKPGDGLKPIREHVRDAALEFVARQQGKSEGVLTGLRDLDHILLGLRPSQVTVLAGRPGTGKSALALQAAMHCGKPVALFTLEMLAQEQIERMMAMEDGRLDSYTLADKNRLKHYEPNIALILSRLATLPIWLNESSNVTPPQILQECRQLQRKHGLSLLVVDYLQLVESVGRHETREREVNYVSKFLKRISNELRIPVLAVASLSRNCETREDKRPLLSDLRESGQVESDAHKVVMLYRDELYKATDRNRGVVEVLIRKNKGGRTGKIPLVFKDNETRFYDMDESAKRAYSNGTQGDEFTQGTRGKERQMPPERSVF